MRHERNRANRAIYRTLAVPLACLLTLAACGSSEKSEQERSADAAMAEASDGSAARAVGDLMSDPSVSAQLGTPSPTPSPAPPPPTGPRMAPLDGPMGFGKPTSQLDATNDQAGEVNGLAVCRMLRDVRAGRPHPLRREDVDAATAEMTRNPAALAECQASL